jgi:hypothetical protein
MKPLLFALFLSAVASASFDIRAQHPVDFSGSWNMDLSRSDAAAQGPVAGPVAMTIQQQPNEVWVETTGAGSTRRVRYVPVGAKTANDEGQLVGTFRWEGSRLTTNLATHINQQAVTVDEVWSLNPEGTELTMEVTLVVQHGYQGGTAQGRTSPNRSTGKNVFLRASGRQ